MKDKKRKKRVVNEEARRNGRIQKAIRRIWSWEPARTRCLQRAQEHDGRYKCAVCAKSYHRKWVHVDHFQPVVDPAVGFQDWNTFINRMFIEGGLQILCTDCHDRKTAAENLLRAKQRAEQRKLKKDLLMAFIVSNVTPSV